MVNNGIVAVMVAGVGGVMSGQILESGFTRSHPKVAFWRWLQKSRSIRLPDFSFSGRLRLHHHTCFCRGIDLSCCQGVIGKKKCHDDRSH